MTHTGLVLGVDRDAGIVHADIDGAQLDARYLGDPPWPLSTCVFESGPAWVCLGPLGHRRQVVHDDFMFARIGFGGEAVGEGGWYDGGTGTVSSLADPDDGAGVIRITMAGSNNCWLRKVDRQVTLESDRVLWASCRARHSGFGVQTFGLADLNVISGGVSAATDAAVTADWSTSTGALTTTTGTSSTSTTVPETVAADTWAWFDVMVAGGQWAALWKDGSGPWVSTTNIPDVTVRSPTLFFRASSAGVAYDLDVDCVTLTQVSDVVDPTDIGPLSDPQPTV